MKKVMYKQANGEEVELTIKRLTFREKNRILSKYIDMKKLSKTEDDNILECFKEDANIFSFMEEVLLGGIVGITLDQLEASEGEELFAQHAKYILGGDTKN
jgi:hypothetical protein